MLEYLLFYYSKPKPLNTLDSSLISVALITKMGEIKISISKEMDKIIKKISDNLGIKKTEFVKSLVIENLKEIKLKHKNEKK